MENLSTSQLKAILEDTQASLAAALGRIEAFRIREKQLMNELSQLRQQVHGSASPEEQQTATPRGARAAAAMPALAPGTAPNTAPSQPQFASPDTELHSPKAPEVLPGWTSPSSQPVYVTNCGGDYPVHIICGSKKVPGSLLVTPEYLDFVEVKARVRQEEFVGISTVKVDALGKDDAESGDGQSGASSSGVWQILWSKNGIPQRQAFEASRATREALHRHTQRWLGEVDSGPDPEGATSEAGELQIAVPRNLTVGNLTLRFVGEPSVILNDLQMRALASAIPPLERMKDWTLSYSTVKHGISLQTLYRRAVNGMPSVLLIRDFGGFTFGCFTPDSWRVAPRYYGSGETFVFQLEPYRVAYPWRSTSDVKNDFFQYGTPECLAVGGVGHFAIWVDADLLAGSSGICGTFGSPCLAHAEEFKVQHLELWQATQ
ncbi:hypothetical protein Vretimale_619 [Volvox reticuliferus]|uniref:Oxidation resistance protein 1 n=1 Tax=Volvox reticuliferus TaxID=1737510 RepID=A0A8J4C0S0_9CHLO|nr:hypothetical protein Vretifemale_2348 [Volvox reticuliferus]GIL94424.1 hypothetical protein Vretimale_619 [Volvox reticuliferus]